MNSKAPSLCRSPIPAKQLLNGQHSGRYCGLCSQRVLKELNHCASPLRRIDHYVSRFSCASCSNPVGLARFFSRYCGGVLGLFHVVFSIILAGRFFGQSPESICFFERSFCGLADLLLRGCSGAASRSLLLVGFMAMLCLRVSRLLPGFFCHRVVDRNKRGDTPPLLRAPLLSKSPLRGAVNKKPRT
jgi:hypothetical protein